MSLLIERHYPLIAALLAALLWWHFSPSFPRDEKEFLGAAISIGSILTGFIATAKAILAALPSDSVMSKIRASGYVDELVRYLGEGLYSCLAFSIYGVLGFFFLEEKSGALSSKYAIGWISLAVYALLSFHRMSSVLLKIIKYSPSSD